jgi:hypothetical protein
MMVWNRLHLILLVAACVSVEATPAQAELRHWFGFSSHGSSGGSSGGFSWGSSGGSSGFFGSHGGWHGSSGGSWGSSGGSSGGSGGSSGLRMTVGPMESGYFVPVSAYQDYAPVMPMAPASVSPAAPMTFGSDAGYSPVVVPSNSVPGGLLVQPVSDPDGIPGTLGRTYLLPSRRVNSDKHPRVGLIEITVSDATFHTLAAGEEVKVSVEDEAGHFDELEGYFGDDDKWHFQTEPLYPGIPHIYDVKFEVVRMEPKRVRKGDKVIEWEVERKVRDLGVRRLRVIPGRTVYLNFP